MPPKTRKGVPFFGIVTLYEVDVRSLMPHQWVRTGILAYFLADLQCRYFMKDVFFVDPSVIQTMIQFGSVECGPVDSFRTARRWLLVINDFSRPAQIDAGEHWSLLLVTKTETEVIGTHFDSACGRNRSHAVAAFNFLCRGEDALVGSPRQWIFTDCKTFPQQRNGYDCGLYVCQAAANVPVVVEECERLGVYVSEAPEELWGAVSAQSTADLRVELYERLIRHWAAPS
jgi:sentrin-specific protease 8